MVHANYPELANWVDLFDDLRRVDLDAIDGAALRMQSSLAHSRHWITCTDDERIKSDMLTAQNQMEREIDALVTAASNTVGNCRALAHHFGIHERRGQSFETFSVVIWDIKEQWKIAQRRADRIHDVAVHLHALEPEHSVDPEHQHQDQHDGIEKAKGIFFLLVSGFVRELFEETHVSTDVIWTIYKLSL